MMSFFMWNQIVLGEKNSILLLKNLTVNKFLHIFSLEVSPRCIHIICGCKYIGSIHQLDVNIGTWCNNPLILAMLLMFWGSKADTLWIRIENEFVMYSRNYM